MPIPRKMVVWLNIYDGKTDTHAREIFTAEHLARAAAGPNAAHVAIPCALEPLTHLMPVTDGVHK